jgi:hypothetical protein
MCSDLCFLEVPGWLPLLLTHEFLSLEVRLLSVTAVAMQHMDVLTPFFVGSTSTYLEYCLRWKSLDAMLSDIHHSTQDYNNLEGERGQ